MQNRAFIEIMELDHGTREFADVTDSVANTEPTIKAQPAAPWVQVLKEGLWNKNPALVQLLGLCPLLAVTSTVVNALGLGIATLFVLVGSNAVVSLIKNQISRAIRLPVFVMVIATFVTLVELIMQAFAYPMYLVLGIFIPLIVTNCAILGRADAFASKQPLLLSLFDGFMMGLGFLMVLVILGAIREIFGQGTLFSDMHLLLGDSARNWTWVIVEDYTPMLFALLPPGAFVAMGFVLAAKNFIDHSNKKSAVNASGASVERARVTGNVS